jgi:miniconductance mechanosensitive channel
MHEFIQKQTENIISLLINNLDIKASLATKLGELFSLLILLIISFLAYKFTVKILRGLVIPLLQRTKTQFDDLLVKHHFFRNIAFLVPAFLIYNFIGDTIISSPGIINVVLKMIDVFFVVILLMIINSILDTINDYYNRYDFAKDHPIKSVIQIFKIFFYIIGLFSVIAMLFDKDLSSLILSLGAASAVIMLIFKDSILGFIGGLQLIFNKMVSIGDWISMPKFGADGTVLEINLTTVKVQNWDKTIITIPTYSLISDSFQNWKGMEESGGRRIKRAIYIDMNSIRFCTPEMLERFRKIQVLNKYIDATENRVVEYNAEHHIDNEILVNGRRQTNIGVFRAYLEAYLSNRNDVNKNMTFMVRQLAPGEKGLPIQIYVFATTTDWVKYEGIQSDIFDHVLAVIPEFDLKIYQYPTDKFLVTQ